MQSIPSFTRLLLILLRVTSFLERGSNGSQRFRITILETFMMSWSTDGLPLDCTGPWNVLIEGWNLFFWFLTQASISNLRTAIARTETWTGLINGILLFSVCWWQFWTFFPGKYHSNFASHPSTIDSLNNDESLNSTDILSRTCYAIQFIWVMIVLDSRTRIPIFFLTGDAVPIMAKHICIISSLRLFLGSDFITASKFGGLQSFSLCSAIAATTLRLLGTLNEFKVEVQFIRDSSDVLPIIEQMLFSCKPDLLISCGTSPRECYWDRWDICIYTGDKGYLGERERGWCCFTSCLQHSSFTFAGNYMPHPKMEIHGQENADCMRGLVPRFIEILKVVLEYAPRNASSKPLLYYYTHARTVLLEFIME